MTPELEKEWFERLLRAAQDVVNGYEPPGFAGEMGHLDPEVLRELAYVVRVFHDDAVKTIEAAQAKPEYGIGEGIWGCGRDQ